MKAVTTLQILSTLTNEDCALLILFFLRKNYFEILMEELSPKIKSSRERLHHRRLQNYVLQSKNSSSIRRLDYDSLSCNQSLYYWGSPYHYSDLFYEKKDINHLKSKPVIRITNICEQNIQHFSRYYGESISEDNIVPIFNFERDASTIGSLTVFTQIIEPRKWWEIEFDGFLYTFKKQGEGNWKVDGYTGNIIGLDYPQTSSFRAWKNRKLPRTFNLRLYLRKLCREDNLEGWRKHAIKGLFTFLTKNLH